MSERGIPRRPIFWTLDQVADMLSLTVRQLRDSYLWMEGVESGVYRKNYLKAVNLAPTRRTGTSAHEWRIAESEFERWLRFHKIYLFDPIDEPPQPKVKVPQVQPVEHIESVRIVLPVEKRIYKNDQSC